MKHKTIIFVPGKNPKPPAEQHRAILWRCLLEGVKRAEPGIARQLESSAEFDLIAWNPLYYDEMKDIARDLPWIDRLLNTHGASDEDIESANHWHKKLVRMLYTVADYFPFLIRFMPEAIRNNARELDRYFHNQDDVATRIRALLKAEITEAVARRAQILLIGHSMGSVIAYDTLWELSHLEQLDYQLDLLTLGSPLGMNYVQKRLQGHAQSGAARYPANIRNWTNLSSVGDVVAVDRRFHDDFEAMLEHGLVEKIEDHCEGIYNFFHNEQGLNCHRSYGYLVNPAVGELIAQWWQSY